MHIHSQRRATGFTLIEIVIVLVILAGIMAMVGPRIFDGLGRAKAKQATIQLHQIATQLEVFKSEIGRYPSQSEGLVALLSAPSGVSNWNGPYVKDAAGLNDPWGNPIRYGLNGSRFELTTLGADNKEGGNGEDADIVVR